MDHRHGFSKSIKDYARSLGFDLVGICRPDPGSDIQNFRDWIEKGYAGEMSYMERNAHKRENPDQILPDIKSVVTCAVNYNTDKPYSTRVKNSENGWIARYAWGDDYHYVINDCLKKLANYMEQIFDESINTKSYVDTGPVLEKVYAKNSGLGWIGKNTCLINQQIGSWLFLGEILTDVELVYDSGVPDRCGSCTKCIDACPTDAITEPYKLDSRRCISYLTIELKGKIPEQFREGIENNIFGCDICQDVCPWNRQAPVTELLNYQSTDNTYNPDLESLLNIDIEEFRTIFKNSPVKRSKRRGFLRNVLVAAGNSGNKKFSPAVSKLLYDEEPLVRAHAVWALWKIEGEKCLSKLYELINDEKEDIVIEELKRILKEEGINGRQGS